MAFRNRKVRPYNPKANPPGVTPQGTPIRESKEQSVFEHSDLSEATKRALKQILEVNESENETAKA